MVTMFTDTVVILRAAVTTGRYGDAVPNWSTVTRTTVTDVSIQPAGALVDAERVDGTRDSTTSRWLAYTPIGSGDLDVCATDRIEYAGRTLEVDGEPRRWPNPITGGVSKVEWSMREVVG